MDKKEYSKMVDEISPSSPLWLNMLKAFLIGGAICTIGEIFRQIYMSLDFSKDQVAALVSITLIFLAQFFTALGLYQKLAKYGGAGTAVPITGFANAVVSPAIEYKTEGFVLGVGAKMFTIAGPVLVYGATASVIAGLIYYIKELVIR